MGLSDELKQGAINLGLCELWQKTWGNPNEDLLLVKYVKGIHWCMERGYPSTEYIIDNFGVDKLEEYSIYVDKKAASENEPTIIIRGDSDFDITYDYYNVGAVWIGDNSKAIIHAKENAIVNVHMYDAAEVEIVREDNAKVHVYRDGNKVIE